MIKNAKFSIIKSWLKVLSSNLGIQVSLDEEGIYSLQIGKERLVIEVTKDFQTMNIFSYLLPLSREDANLKLALMIKALELNAFSNITVGGALAVAPGHEFLIYARALNVSATTATEFVQIFDSILETAPKLRELLMGRIDASSN